MQQFYVGASYGTPFMETEALLAVMNGDQATAAQIAAEMLPGERRVFVLQLEMLQHLVEGAR